MSIANKDINILNQNVGIAGCGEMGYPMLKVLLRNNINATGHDVKQKINYEEFGDKFISSKSEFFDKNDIFLSIVRDKKQTDDLLINNTVLKSKTNATILICSTLSTNYIYKLKKNLPSYFTILDTPMSGSTIKAEQGKLTFMVGGNKNDIKNIIPLLNILGEQIFHIGEYGSGMSIKLLNNFVAASSVLATRNVLSQIHNFGLTKKQLLDVIKCSTGDNWFAQNYDELSWSKENFLKTNTMGILEKDLLSYLESKSNIEKKMPIDNFENSLVEGIKNIPENP